MQSIGEHTCHVRKELRVTAYASDHMEIVVCDIKWQSLEQDLSSKLFISSDVFKDVLILPK